MRTAVGSGRFGCHSVGRDGQVEKWRAPECVGEEDHALSIEDVTSGTGCSGAWQGINWKRVIL